MQTYTPAYSAISGHNSLLNHSNKDNEYYKNENDRETGRKKDFHNPFLSDSQLVYFF